MPFTLEEARFFRAVSKCERDSVLKADRYLSTLTLPSDER